MKAHRIVILIVCFLIGNSSQAQNPLDSELFFKDTHQQFHFGHAQLGEAKERIKNIVAHSDSCYENEIANSYDCEYYDHHGVAYLVYGNTILRKRIEITPDQTKAQLPLKLTPTDTIIDVINKLNQLTGSRIDWAFSVKDKHVYLETRQTIINTQGESYGFTLIFNTEGELQTIEARADW